MLFTGSRQSTSTPEFDNRVRAFKQQVLDETPDNQTKEDNLSDDYRASSSNNNNLISEPENYCSDQLCSDQVLLNSQSSISKVKQYVEGLPSPTVNQQWNNSDRGHNSPAQPHNKTVLDESFSSEASSRSKLSSRQSDALSLNNRYNSSGMFYGTNLTGQTVCPFPSDWQFQTIPESIENNQEID